MAAGNRHFIQQFGSEFEGIDAESSPIEQEGTSVNRAVNYEIGGSNSLRGRVGHQLGGTLGFFYGLFNYTWSRTQDEYVPAYQTSAGVYPARTGSIGSTLVSADGVTKSKLILLNRWAWQRDTFTVPVTRVSGSYPFTWYLTRSNPAGSFNFIIKANGVAILTYDCGNGQESYMSIKTIYDLLGAIDATAELSVNRFDRAVCPPCATVNGAQYPVNVASATWGRIRRITVNAGHSFVPGDRLTWFQPDNVDGMVGGWIIATTGTTIDYVSENTTFATQLQNGQVLGYQAQAAVGFDIGPARSASSGTLGITFPYFRMLPSVETEYNGGPFLSAQTSFIGAAVNSFVPPSSVSADSNLYIATSSYPSASFSYAYSSKLMKYDGAQVTRAGLPTPSTFTAVAAAGGALAGVYKYKAFVKRYDAQGNIIEGPISAVTSVTLGGGNNQTTITAQAFNYGSYTGFGVKSCYKYTAEAPAANQACYVDDNTGAPGNNGYLEVGDPVCFYDNAGTLHRTRVTAYDGTTAPSSVKFADASGYTIANDTPISTGVTVTVLRTTAGGNQYYILREIVTTGYATTTYTDNISDATLSAGTQWEDPEIGKEHDAPPSCSLVCQHQGGLVVARNPSQPNNVSFSTADGIEYFPVASNNFDIPSTVTGPISAIASDTNDRLAVFKDRAYYDVVGDLDSGAFSVNVKHEGDYGIASQASIARVNGRLVGISRQGIVVVSDGELDAQTFRKLNARFTNRDYKFEWSSGVNDYFNRQYIITVPTIYDASTYPVTFVVDYSRPKLLTFEREYGGGAAGVQPGTYAMLDNDLFYLDRDRYVAGYLYKRLYRFNGDSPSGNDGDSFFDHTFNPDYILESEPYTFGEPGLLKTPQRIRIWSIPNEEVVSGWVPFTVDVQTACAPIGSLVGSPNPGATDSTVSFANTTSDWFKDVKLVPNKTHFYIVRLTTNLAGASPFISGWEIMFSLNYDKDDFVK